MPSACTGLYCHRWPVRLPVHTHYLINGAVFRKKTVLKHCQKYFKLQERFSQIWSKMYIGFHAKYRLYLSNFKENSVFLTDFRIILKYEIS